MNKYDNISIHCNLQITGSEQKQEYLYSSSPVVEFANSLDPDEAAHYELPHLDLLCLPYSLKFVSMI